MASCPACGAEDIAAQTECRCGADLTLLARLDGIADAWFNRGLAALREGAPGHALEWFSACCAARPGDVDARLAQVRVWAQLGRWREAAGALDRAAAVDPAARDVEELRQALTPAGKKRKSREVAHGHRGGH